MWASSFVLAWQSTDGDAERWRLGGVHAANAGLNVLWRYFFFHFFHRRWPDLALIETVPFLASILVLVFVAGQFDARAAWLISPYLVLGAFATVRIAAIVSFNAASRRLRV